jgi:hypothetical protein
MEGVQLTLPPPLIARQIQAVVAHTLTPVLEVNTFTHPQPITTHLQHIPTHLQHTITLLLAVNTLTQLLVLLLDHNTLTLCHPQHRFPGQQLTLL